jgi:hypothetical protein
MQPFEFLKKIIVKVFICVGQSHFTKFFSAENFSEWKCFINLSYGYTGNTFLAMAMQWW